MFVKNTFSLCVSVFLIGVLATAPLSGLKGNGYVKNKQNKSHTGHHHVDSKRTDGGGHSGSNHHGNKSGGAGDHRAPNAPSQGMRHRFMVHMERLATHTKNYVSETMSNAANHMAAEYQPHIAKGVIRGIRDYLRSPEFKKKFLNNP